MTAMEAKVRENGLARGDPLGRYGDPLTVENMSDVLQVSVRTIYRLCDKEELPFVKVGRRLYFPKRKVIERLQLEATD